jgi:hypothetical protein
VASNKALLASVTKEMSKPRTTKSAQLETDRQIKARRVHILMRCKPQFSSEIDGTLNRIERLRQIRMGQPLSPQVDVKIT